MSHLLTQDPKIRHAIRVIKEQYGQDVSVDAKDKDLSKFGRNTAIDTNPATVMTLPSGVYQESYVSDNLIVQYSSSKAADSTTVLTIEGHTISGNDLTFVTQTTALNGQSSTALGTPLARATRAYVSTGTEDLEGNIYFAEGCNVASGVPDTNSYVHMIIPSGLNQTEKASTSLSSTDYWLISSIHVSIYEKTAGFADVLLETRKIGSVFLQKERLAVNTGGGFTQIFFDPYIIIPPNTDVRLTAVGDAATAVGAGIEGYLAKVV